MKIIDSINRSGSLAQHPESVEYQVRLLCGVEEATFQRPGFTPPLPINFSSNASLINNLKWMNLWPSWWIHYLMSVPLHKMSLFASAGHFGPIFHLPSLGTKEQKYLFSFWEASAAVIMAVICYFLCSNAAVLLDLSQCERGWPFNWDCDYFKSFKYTPFLLTSYSRRIQRRNYFRGWSRK